MNKSDNLTDGVQQIQHDSLNAVFELAREFVSHDEEAYVRERIEKYYVSNVAEPDIYGLDSLERVISTALIAINEIGLKRDGVLAILLFRFVETDSMTIAEIRDKLGKGVADIISGISRVHSLYEKTPTVSSENFRNLLLSFAEDMRVILIMIADRVSLMRLLKNCANEAAMRRASEEASYLYAPLAHKLGLYVLKSELEDLSLKYLEHDAYYHIREKLNATKKSRDAYINRFIVPIKEKLEQHGLKFHIKGRTKSINSIWQKMKKQRCPFEGVYDLFAIRIILDSEPEREKMECWQVYSVITDMYQPNPKRLRDWLSVPKSNGYESLHITVLGPENKWVEVQIRTSRMDDIAEHGLAAHWRYKGVKSETGGLDEWLSSIRALMEAGDDLQVMDQFKTSMYEKEIYVFTPTGDIRKLSAGATVLDFAFHIHSKVGCQCTGAKVNGRIVNLRHKLQSGDQVQILTSAQQKPRREWLQIASTSRAKSKIRLALKETIVKEISITKEMIERRLKNRKVEFDEGIIQQLVKKMGFREVSDFYKNVADETLDIQSVVDGYMEIKNQRSATAPQPAEEERRSAADFVFKDDEKRADSSRKNKSVFSDTLVIDQSQKGIDYTLANCCRPIYGDDIFGFVTVSGGIKIHRTDCPNATELHKRFGYRIVDAKWSGKGQNTYSITLRIIGNDDIGIVSNITSIISKDEKIMMRSINIDSKDGLFSGNLVVNVDDTGRLQQLIKKLKTVKGVRQVERI
ncbi:MAG: bifunctional (p)ppGpp synthetase/guanosine-3',5'-bis(diphosphate) 3'-pyrophosphohydrolase [Prevotella sp.]|nr:bifunctional (p)ppGpp synthetase/guanosine-3',5'-bis(diphosphate) 3'-pyrophosphohydrolase [Prevotella sp.]